MADLFRHMHAAIGAGDGEGWKEKTNAKADAVVLPASIVLEIGPDECAAGLLAHHKENNDDNEEE